MDELLKIKEEKEEEKKKALLNSKLTNTLSNISSKRNVLESSKSLSKVLQGGDSSMSQLSTEATKKTVVRSLVPNVRRRGIVKVTNGGRKARFQKKEEDDDDDDDEASSSGEEDEESEDNDEEGDDPDAEQKGKKAPNIKMGPVEIEATLRKALTTNEFHIHLVQLGAEFRIGISTALLNILSQFESDIGLYIIKGKGKATMNKLENLEHAGRMDKKNAKVIFLGDIPKKKNFNPKWQLKEDPQKFKPPSHKTFDKCFQLNTTYKDMVTNIMDWQGLVIAKKAESYPISSHPGIFIYTTLEKLIEDRVADIAAFEAKQNELAVLEQKMQEASSWTPGQGLKKIRRLLKPKLRYFDRDGSGDIEFDEFKAVMENLGVFLTETRLQKLFKACDLDRSGSVELEELPLALHINDQLKPKPFLSPKDAFELFDYDGSGELNEQEFFEVIQTLSVTAMSREDATKIFQKNDTDKSGQIEYPEFREIWLSLCDVDREIAIRTEGAVVPPPRKKPIGGRRRKKKVDELRELLIAEETREKKEFEESCEKCYQDMRDLRMEIDLKRQEQKKLRRREALAARVAVSKAERELRRQKQLEESQRAKIQAKEEGLRTQLDKEMRYREEKERADRAAEREYRQKLEKEARAKRGDDKLDMRNRDLREIPKEIYAGKVAQERLAHMILMDFRDNKLVSLPKNGFLFWCGALRKLDLAQNRLTSIPSEIESLENLQILSLVHNHLSELPAELGNLKSLCALDLGENELSELFPGIGELKGTLTKLSLHRNSLELLPGELGKLAQLEVLDLSLNRIVELPEEFDGLQELKSLDCSWNRLRKFPRGLGKLESLQTLNMSGNELRRLPDSLDGLKSLQILDMGRNDLVEIPPSIKGLVLLLRLDVSHNNIHFLPKEIGDVRSVQYLDFSNNFIRVLPESCGKLRSLLLLNLQNNKLTKLPDEIGAASLLQKLIVSENEIVGRPPPSIGSLRHLVHLDFSNNKLTAIPASFGALVALVYFDLSQNNIGLLPSSIGCLRSLEVFRISRNQVREIPATIGNLADTLLEFDLSSNLLEWLPAEIGTLKKLRRLDLHHNRLRAVPSELGRLVPQLEMFSVTHNPLTEFPRKFANDVKTSEKSQLLWSGYSDGQVADYIIEISDLFEVCKEHINLKKLMAPISEPRSNRQTLQEFSDLVKESLERDGKWREQLRKHVYKFYFRAKDLGTIPRLDSLYGHDKEQRNATIDYRTKEKTELCQRVKEEEEAKVMKLEHAYTVSSQKLIFTESKLDDRREFLYKDKLERTKRAVEDAGRACRVRQERICRETRERREKERKKQLNSWFEHFVKTRTEYIEECKEKYGYDEQPSANDSWMAL